MPDRDLFFQVFESSPIPMTLARREDGAWIAVNGAMTALVGYSREEVLGRNSVQVGILKAEAREGLMAVLARGEGLRGVEIELRTKAGESRTVLASTDGIVIDGRPCILSTAIDITDRKRMDDFRSGQNRILEMMTTGAGLDEVLRDLLRLAEAHSRGMLGSVLLLGKDGRRILRGIAPSLPEAFASVFDGFPIGPKAGSCGTAMHRGETVIVEDIAADPLWEEYRAAAAHFGLRACWSMPILSRTGEVLGSFAMYYREPRRPIPSELDLLAAAVRMAGLALEKDRVEAALRQVEEQFRQAQKMEAVGLLAGGIAHDFNNLLTAINGYSELAMQGLGADHPVYAPIREILKAGDRAAGLTKQLLAYSRKQVLAPKVWDLNTVLEELVAMLRRFIGEDVRLDCVPGPGSMWVRVDRSQIEQVLMNLVVNARDAMPRGGRVRLEVDKLDVSGIPPVDFPQSEPGSYVRLTVSDSGSGMPPEVLERIFEPFFTTKDLGKGTGLGLSVVQGIVRQSGGHVAVRSRVGQGTGFHILLPASTEAPAEEPASTGPGPITLRGHETLLLVEDEALVRNLVSRVLESLGYSIVQARDGVEALEKLDSVTADIALVITDVVMPDLGGRDLAQRIRALRPGLPILLMSGHADGAWPEIAAPDPAATDSAEEFLRKPFSPTDLARKVRVMLDAEKSRERGLFP